MGRKTSREIYVGGYDKEFYVDSMSNSHIINCLTLIKAKMETIEELVGAGYDKGVKQSYDCLVADQHMLAVELDKREDCTESC